MMVQRGKWHAGAQRDAGLAYARDWRERNRAMFDAMDSRGAFADSITRLNGRHLLRVT